MNAMMELSVLINEYGYFWHMLNERENGDIYDFMNEHGDDIAGEGYALLQRRLEQQLRLL